MHPIRLTACLTAAAMLCGGTFSAAAQVPQEGKLLYHSYSSYAAMDSTLQLHDFCTGETQRFTNDSFVHAMNGDFGSHCYDVTFMAIDPTADEWDIFRWNTLSGALTNLTAHSGFRNEDPKFSPDGNRIVFKRGHWDAQTDGFVYDLAEIDLRTGEITMLTDTPAEESMPCYAPDGTCIYYAALQDGETSICSLNPQSGSTQVLYTEHGVHAYYPMISDAGLYFTKWHSASLQNDCIVTMGEDAPVVLPFNDTAYNCSDPFPLRDGSLFFSSTSSGGYDLCFFDGTQTHPLPSLSTALADLGSSYYGRSDAEEVIARTADFLLQRGDSGMNMDADGNGIVNAFDLALLKRMMK